MKKSELDEIEAIKTKIAKTNIEIIGIHYTGFTIQIFFMLPKGFFGKMPSMDVERAFLNRITYLYPELLLRMKYGNYDVVWGSINEQIQSLFLFENMNMYFLNIENKMSEFEELRKKFQYRWKCNQNKSTKV